MKKNLFMSLLLASAVLLGSCDGNLSGGGDGTEGGSFEGGGISKSYMYATDYYVYGEQEDGVYSHLLVLTNIPYSPFTPDNVLEEGQKLDLFMIYYMSESEQLETSSMSYFDYFGEGNLPDKLPFYVEMGMYGKVGTSSPYIDEYSYKCFSDDQEGQLTKLNVVRDGEFYEISANDVVFSGYLTEDEDVKFKGNLIFRGPIKRVERDNLGS